MSTVCIYMYAGTRRCGKRQFQPLSWHKVPIHFSYSLFWSVCAELCFEMCFINKIDLDFWVKIPDFKEMTDGNHTTFGQREWHWSSDNTCGYFSRLFGNPGRMFMIISYAHVLSQSSHRGRKSKPDQIQRTTKDEWASETSRGGHANQTQ